MTILQSHPLHLQVNERPVQAHELSLVLAQLGVGDGASVVAEMGGMRDPVVASHLDLASPDNATEACLPGCVGPLHIAAYRHLLRSLLLPPCTMF